MKLGIILNADEEGFALAAKNGLSFIEICQNIGCDCKAFAQKADEIKGLMKKYGIAIGAVGRWGADKFDENAQIIEEELENSHILIDLAAELGCSVFNTGVNYVNGISKFQNIANSIEYLQNLMDYGKTKGVQIAVYNCRWNNYIVDPEYWELIHGHMPELGIKYDPTHCINEGSGDYLGEMKDWGNRFLHVHIKGTINVNGDHVDDPPAGLDQINWGAFMGILYKFGYDGNLSIEPHSNTWFGELAEPGIAFTVKYMSQFILNN